MKVSGISSGQTYVTIEGDKAIKIEEDVQLN